MTGAGGSAAYLDEDQERVLAALLGMQRQSWEQGVATHALLDLGRHDLVRVMAREAVTRQTAAGKLAEIDDHAAVNCVANGEAVRWAAALAEPTGASVGDLHFGDALQRQVDWLVGTAPRAGDADSVPYRGQARGVGGHRLHGGSLPGAHRTRAGRRDAACGPSISPLRPVDGVVLGALGRGRAAAVAGRRVGTGNGWVVAGIARALRHLQGRAVVDDEFRRAAAAHARDVIDACLRHRDTSGVFHDVVDDPSTFPETNLAQMLAYAILTGVADGWLPPDYRDVARSLIAAARARVDADGFVSPVCGAPRFDAPGTSAEAQSFFLLATAAERAT